MAVDDMSLAMAYHERTKYTYEGVTASNQTLDWAKKPPLFREFRDSPRVSLAHLLPFPLPGSDDPLLAAAMQLDLPPPASSPTEERALARLSRLLYFSAGVTRVVPYPGEPFYMRAVPSAGGLYPADVLLLARSYPGLKDGCYYFDARSQRLVLTRPGAPLEPLLTYAFHHPAMQSARLVVVLVAVFTRSEWRYQERAYRRILLDTGHLLGNLSFYAPAEGFMVHPIGGFADDGVNDYLGLRRDHEGALVLCPLLPKSSELPAAPALRSNIVRVRDLAEDKLAQPGLLRLLHQETGIEAGHPARRPLGCDVPADVLREQRRGQFLSAIRFKAKPIRWDRDNIQQTIVDRRSTRAFSGDALSVPEVAAILEFAYRPDLHRRRTSWGLPCFFQHQLIDTYLIVHAIDGIPAGVYSYQPRYRELRPLRQANLKSAVHYLCLWQELGRDAACVVLHLANFPKALLRLGDRAYRYLHLDAGHLGQRLNLAATHLGVGVSGIGGFFDDDVNELCGVDDDNIVLYLTVLGRPA